MSRRKHEPPDVFVVLVFVMAVGGLVFLWWLAGRVS